MLKKTKLKINHALFGETSHSPALIDIVGPELIHKVVDFCFIANPYYPDKHMVRWLQKQLPLAIKMYPSSNPGLSQQHLATVVHVNPNHLVIGNGATELITIIQNELVENIGIPVPTFSEYTDKVKHQKQAKLFQLPPHNQYQLNLNHYADWIIEQKLTSALVINPGNPTGQVLSVSQMRKFIERLSHLDVILVDESFIDFAATAVPSLLPYIEEYYNVIIVRSMSKHCGVPGLRLGYVGTANERFLSILRNALPVWNINTLAEFFLKNLEITDRQYHDARIKVIADIDYLYAELKKIPGFYVYDTGCNFILIKSECGLNATQLQQILLEDYWVYVRDCSNKIGLDNYHIRVASQGRKKDKVLIKALHHLAQRLKNKAIKL
jgi:threonine-phosphate decarboxylase